MTYLLTSSASVQATSATSDFQTLVKHSVSALEIDSSLIIPVNLLANTVTEIELPSIEKVKLIAIKSANPIEISLAQSSGNDVFNGMPSQFHMLVRTEGVVIQQLKLRSAVAGKVEVVVCGTFT